MPKTFSKDAQATLDYAIDWTDWLGSDTIASSTWSVPSGITSVSTSNTSKKATIFLSGGSVGSTYQLTNRITTSNSPQRVEERSIKILITQK